MFPLSTSSVAPFQSSSISYHFREGVNRDLTLEQRNELERQV